MPERVRVGVIGAGGIGVARHLPAYKACAEMGKAAIVAVCDPVAANAKRAAEQFGVANVYANYQDLLARTDIDAVSVCTPNASHEPVTLAALAAGKHVMCEKPLAVSLAGAERMYSAALETGLKTAVNFRYRFIPAAMFVRDLIQGGELGTIYHVYAQYLSGYLHDPMAPLRWRMVRSETGTGALGDLGSHLIDLTRYWIGEFAEVSSSFRTFTTERPLVGGGTGLVDVDDAASFFVRFTEGADGVFSATRCALGRNNHQRVEIYGTKGAVIYEIEKWDRGGDSLRICFGSSQGAHEGFATVMVPPEYLAGTPLRPMIDFVDAIRADRPASPDLLDGLRCQEVLEAVEVSASERRWVEVSRLTS